MTEQRREYPALRGCIEHDMQYGVLTPPDGVDPLASIEAELRKKGFKGEIVPCRAIMFAPEDGKCGEVFVLVPEQFRDLMDGITAAANAVAVVQALIAQRAERN